MIDTIVATGLAPALVITSIARVLIAIVTGFDVELTDAVAAAC